MALRCKHQQLLDDHPCGCEATPSLLQHSSSDNNCRSCTSVSSSAAPSVFEQPSPDYNTTSIQTSFPHFLLSLRPTLSHKGGVRRCGLAPGLPAEQPFPEPLSVICSRSSAAAPRSHSSSDQVQAAHTRQQEFSRRFQQLDGRRCGPSCTSAWTLCQTVEEEVSCCALVHLSEGGFCLEHNRRAQLSELLLLRSRAAFM